MGLVLEQPVQGREHVFESLPETLVERLALDVLQEHVAGVFFDAFFHFGLNGQEELVLGECGDDVEVVVVY